MIVQCPQCQTKFNLADEKITEKGLKVRCSKCKNVFEVKKEPLATGGAVSKPKVEEKEKFDFSGEFEFAEEKFSTERAPTTPAQKDYAFSQDLSSSPAAKGEEEEFNFEEEEADFSSSDEFGAEEKVGDLGMSPEMPEIPGGEEKTEDFLDEGLDDFKIDRGTEIPARTSSPPPAKEEELGEEFDFSAKLESYARPEMPVRTKAETSDELEAKLDLEAEAPSPPVTPAATVQVREPKPKIPPRPIPPPYSEEKRGSFKSFLIIVLILILLSPVFGLFYLHLTGSFKIPELFQAGGFAKLKNVPEINQLLVKLGLAQEPLKGEIAVLKDTVSYQVIKRLDNTQIAVVLGKVRNDYPVPVEYIQVEVSLYDQNRNLLAVGSSYCDVSFSKSELATMSQTEIEEYMDTAAGRNMQNQRIEPGAQREFTVVFFQIPLGVAHYDVKVKNFGILKTGG